MVPTVDTTKYAFCLESLLSIEKPSFFTGNSGVGKSVVIQNQLQQIKDRGALVIITINMSAQTTSAKTQQGIQEKLEKKKRTILGAVGKKVAVFVDDINMPTVETYGA
jgi:dynein heavy chain